MTEPYQLSINLGQAITVAYQRQIDHLLSYPCPEHHGVRLVDCQEPHSWNVPDKKDATGFIQWKGSRVCIDLTCSCGRRVHYDGGFLYAWKCRCGRVWDMLDEVKMTAHDPMVATPPCIQDFSGFVDQYTMLGQSDHGEFQYLGRNDPEYIESEP